MVRAFDQRGHGRSDGPRGHVSTWGHYLLDAREQLEGLLTQAPELPVFVYGHSIGALIALGLAMRSDREDVRFEGRPRGVAGWIISGAGIEPTGIARPHLVATAKLLSRIAPRVSLDLGIDAEALSHDDAVIAAYRDDPLIGRRATVRWGTEALAAIRAIKAGASGIEDPLLVLHGSADTLARPRGSRWLAAETAGEVRLEVYDGARHEPHNDPEYADVASDILSWIQHVVKTMRRSPDRYRPIPLSTYRRYSEEEMVERASAFRDDMRRRRTVRHFSAEAVPEAVIDACVEAAATAPNGANMQPWHFVVVRDPAVKSRIRAAAEKEEIDFYEHRAPPEWLDALARLGTDEHKAFLEQAPVLIVIFGESYGLSEDGSKIKNYYVTESVGIATGILITGLHRSGLATLTHTPSPMGFLNEILDRPKNERPFLMLVVGYPEEGSLIPDITKKPLDEISTAI